MFNKSAVLYDAFYSFKNYASEAATINGVIHRHKSSPGVTLLDVACGTGTHITHWLDENCGYEIEGLDLDAGLLAVAKERNPNTVFHLGDMRNFSLNKQFDIITCLFSAIGYVRTEEGLEQSIKNFAHHLKPGGVLIVEPWFTPEAYIEGTVHANVVDKPEMKLVRMNVSQKIDQLSVMEFHYLVGTADGVEHFTEMHQLGLFSHERYMQAFENEGLDVKYDPVGLTDRGLYIGIKPGQPSL